jgi:hypothetical protein
MNSPNSQMDAAPFQCFSPGEYVLVNTFYECAIQVEQESRLGRKSFSRLHLRLPLKVNLIFPVLSVTPG